MRFLTFSRFILFLSSFLLLVGPLSHASFDLGVQAYKEGRFQEASKSFFDLSQQHPDNPEVLYNLGLSSYKQGRRGLALGLWRKARSVRPTPHSEQAIVFVEEELGMSQKSSAISSQITHWISQQSLFFFYGIVLILTLLIGFPLTTYFAKRKLPILQWPPWVFVALPVWFAFVGCSIWQTLARQTTYGTVVFTEISTRTSPSLDAPTLTPLDEGAHVQILKTHKDWLQIKGPSGVPGWVLSEKIISEKGS